MTRKHSAMLPCHALNSPCGAGSLFLINRSQGQKKKNFSCFSKNYFYFEQSGSLTRVRKPAFITRLSLLVISRPVSWPGDCQAASVLLKPFEPCNSYVSRALSYLFFAFAKKEKADGPRPIHSVIRGAGEARAQAAAPPGEP